MMRARGIGKLPKVGRERKSEPRIENQRACRKKERLPEVFMLEEEQCMPRRKQKSSLIHISIYVYIYIQLLA